MNEEWLIRVDNLDFVTDREGRDKVIKAMQEDKRFVSISAKDIISVRHISYIYLKSKKPSNLLQEGDKKEHRPTQEELRRVEDIKKQTRDKMGWSKKKD